MNAQKTESDGRYDLEERLLEYSAAIVRMTDGLYGSMAANHVAGQVLRSGTAALPNQGEAQAAESQADFVHKMKICLKELRENPAVAAPHPAVSVGQESRFSRAPDRRDRTAHPNLLPQHSNRTSPQAT